MAGPVKDPRAHALREGYHKVFAELAGWFGVSEETMRWRLCNVGLVEEPPSQ